MFIQIQDTPNPNTLKFLPGADVLELGDSALTIDRNGDNIKNIPLAKQIFDIDNGISSIFLGKDFISVTKSSEVEWYKLKTLVLSAIMDFILSGQKFVNESEKLKSYQKANESPSIDNEIIAQIIELIDTKIRPAVAEDGGDIEFDRFEDGIVYLRMHGACSGCPSSAITLKNGIENMLKHYVPEVKEVQQVI